MNPAPFFSEIPDPENTLPDPDLMAGAANQMVRTIQWNCDNLAGTILHKKISINYTILW